MLRQIEGNSKTNNFIWNQKNSAVIGAAPPSAHVDFDKEFYALMKTQQHIGIQEKRAQKKRSRTMKKEKLSSHLADPIIEGVIKFDQIPNHMDMVVAPTLVRE